MNFIRFLSERNSQPTYTRADYDAMIKAAAEKHGVPLDVMRHVIRTETGHLSPDKAATAVSNKGAVGVGQLMPSTIKDYNVKDPSDPRQSIDASARIMADHLKNYKGNVPQAFAAFNAGPGVVADYLNGTNKSGKNPNKRTTTDGIPPFKETQDYINSFVPDNGSTVPDVSTRVADTAKTVATKSVAAATGSKSANAETPPKAQGEKMANNTNTTQQQQAPDAEDPRSSTQQKADRLAHPYSPTAGFLSAALGSDWRTNPNAFTSKNSLVQAANTKGLPLPMRALLGTAAAAIDDKKTAGEPAIAKNGDNKTPANNTGVAPGTKADLGFDSSMLWGTAEKKQDGKWYDGLGRVLPAEKSAEAEKRAGADQAQAAAAKTADTQSSQQTVRLGFGDPGYTPIVGNKVEKRSDGNWYRPGDNMPVPSNVAKHAETQLAQQNKGQTVAGSQQPPAGQNATARSINTAKAVGDNTAAAATNSANAATQNKAVTATNSANAATQNKAEPVAPATAAPAKAEPVAPAAAAPVKSVNTPAAATTAEPKPGSWQEIAKLNNITDPTKLKAGSHIELPNGQGSYYVTKGDTLSGIAQRLNTTGDPQLNQPGSVNKPSVEPAVSSPAAVVKPAIPTLDKTDIATYDKSFQYGLDQRDAQEKINAKNAVSIDTTTQNNTKSLAGGDGYNGRSDQVKNQGLGNEPTVDRLQALAGNKDKPISVPVKNNPLALDKGDQLIPLARTDVKQNPAVQGPNLTNEPVSQIKTTLDKIDNIQSSPPAAAAEKPAEPNVQTQPTVKIEPSKTVQDKAAGAFANIGNTDTSSELDSMGAGDTAIRATNNANLAAGNGKVSSLPKVDQQQLRANQAQDQKSIPREIVKQAPVSAVSPVLATAPVSAASSNSSSNLPSAPSTTDYSLPKPPTSSSIGTIKVAPQRSVTSIDDIKGNGLNQGSSPVAGLTKPASPPEPVSALPQTDIIEPTKVAPTVIPDSKQSTPPPKIPVKSEPAPPVQGESISKGNRWSFISGLI